MTLSYFIQCHRNSKVKLEIAVADDIAESVIEAVSRTANTGKIGDGKVFVLDLEQALRIRTGDRDAAAIAAWGTHPLIPAKAGTQVKSTRSLAKPEIGGRPPLAVRDESGSRPAPG